MAKYKNRILVVDDNNGIRAALKLLLGLHFTEVELIPSPKEIMSRISSFHPDVVLLDMNFHTDINTGNEGLFWLSEIKRQWPETEVVLFTAYADIQLAVEGMKRGAFDFIVKPWENETMVQTLKAAGDKACKKNRSVSKAVEPEMYWGHSRQMKAIKATIEKIAATDATVLITGENGTGKDVLACHIHKMSDRAAKPMVNVDAGAITESLFESEMFGHIKGAFTDAHSDHTGKFELADSGTLFLDEIGNIPLHLQAKLLRVLQNRCITRVGDTRQIPVNIRLICATNKNLEKMVEEGKFREDLYYRINTVGIHLPPLRERKDEIGPLTELFIRNFSRKYRRQVSGITDEALQLLKNANWDGNIRELQNCMEKAVIMSDHEYLEPADIEIPKDSKKPASKDMSLQIAEEESIRAAMDKFGGNLSMVAKVLGISRPTLYAKLKKYGI